MDTLPLELLGAIALNLPLADLRHFRLLGRRYADAGFPALVREISFMNTLDTADALQTLSRSPYGSLGAARHLTIYDGAWPIAASQEEWASQLLFLNKGKQCSPTATQLAYHRYERFLRQEAPRTFETDVHLFRSVLAHFPSLRELTLSRIRAWRMHDRDHAHFRDLTNSIWVIPSFENVVAKTMSRLLPALGTCSRLERLNVDGPLDTQDLAPNQYRFNTIRHLCLKAILVGEGRENSIANFLGAFPGLTALTIKTFRLGPVSHQRLPLEQMLWSDLQSADIIGTPVPENELFSFTKRHPLKRLTLKEVTLTSGSWKSFFSRARKLQPRPDFVCHGILNSSDPIEDAVSQRLLDRFLTNAEMAWPFWDPGDEMPWPFWDPDDDISIFSLSL